MAEDRLMQFKGTIYESGYGIIAKKVMKDPHLSIEAKAIYAYLCAYAGNNQESFPGENLIKHELNIGRNRFYKYLKELINSGYIIKSKNRDSKGQYKSNLYSIEAVPCIQNRDMENQDMENQDMENQDIEYEDATSNNTTNNNITNNNLIGSSNELLNKDVYNHYEQCGFGLLNKTLIDLIDTDIDIYSKEWVVDAMTEAVRQNKFKLSFVEGILRNWKADGRKPRVNKEVSRIGSNKRTNKSSYTTGPSEETQRLEEYARQQGINLHNLKDIECDY